MLSLLVEAISNWIGLDTSKVKFKLRQLLLASYQFLLPPHQKPFESIFFFGKNRGHLFSRKKNWNCFLCSRK